MLFRQALNVPLDAHSSNLTDLEAFTRISLHPTGQVWPLLGRPGQLQANTAGERARRRWSQGCGWDTNTEGASEEEESKGRE